MPGDRRRLRFSGRIVLQIRLAVDPPSQGLHRTCDVLIDQDRVSVGID
jgi:hypothetical protein